MHNDLLDLPADVQYITLDELRRGGRPMTVLERVEQAALGKLDMTSEELAAAKLFLSKTQPDLKAEEQTGKDGGPIQHHHTVEFVGTNTVTAKT